MNLKNTLLTLIAAGITFLAPKLVEGINVNGFFIDTPNCSTKVWRVNPVDTLWDETNSRGKWGIETNNFSPPAQQGDSLYVEGGWNLGGKAKASWVRGPPGENQVYDLHLEKFTGCIKEIVDTSNLADTIPLKCEYWISGFDSETTDVDTHNIGFRHYYDAHLPFEDSQAQPGAWAHYKLYKIVKDSPDTAYVTEDSIPVNRDAFDAQLFADSVYFPLEKIIIGVEEEQKQEAPKKERIVKQTLGTTFDIKGSWALYNLIGNKVAEYKSYNNNYVRHNFSSGKDSFPQGIYFLKPEDPKDPMEKIIILRK